MIELLFCCAFVLIAYIARLEYDDRDVVSLANGYHHLLDCTVVVCNAVRAVCLSVHFYDFRFRCPFFGLLYLSAPAFVLDKTVGAAGPFNVSLYFGKFNLHRVPVSNTLGLVDGICVEILSQYLFASGVLFVKLFK